MEKFHRMRKWFGDADVGKSLDGIIQSFWAGRFLRWLEWQKRPSLVCRTVFFSLLLVSKCDFSLCTSFFKKR